MRSAMSRDELPRADVLGARHEIVRNFLTPGDIRATIEFCEQSLNPLPAFKRRTSLTETISCSAQCLKPSRARGWGGASVRRTLSHSIGSSSTSYSSPWRPWRLRPGPLTCLARETMMGAPAAAAMTIYGSFVEDWMGQNLLRLLGLAPTLSMLARASRVSSICTVTNAALVATSCRCS